MKNRLLLLVMGFTFVSQLVNCQSISSSLGTTICVGQTTKLKGPSSNTNVTYFWYPYRPAVDDCTTSFGGGHTLDLTVTGPITIYCKQYCGVSTTPVYSISLNVYPQSGIPKISTNVSTNLCQGDSVVLTASNGNSYLWSNGATTQNITVNQAGNYSVKVTNSYGCSQTSAVTSVTTTPKPSSPIASNSGITCVGNALSLSASTIAGATYSWTGPNGFTSSLQNPLVSDNATLQMAGTYTVTASVNGCSNTPATTNVIINQATINSNSSVCEGSALSLSASNISGASYFWTGPNGFSSTSQNPTISTNATTNMAGVYSVYTIANGYTSPIPGTIDIVVTPKPAAPIPSNSGPVCVGNNLSLSVPSIAGATYQWTGPNSFTSTIQNPNVSTSASALMGGVYNVVTTIDGCSSNAGSTTVQINKITSTNNGPVCSGTTLSLGATAITGATYSWTGPNGFTSTQQNPIVSANSTSAMAGVYSVTSTVNGCTSPSSVTIASINPSPVTPVVTQIANTLNSSLAIGNQWYSQNGKIIGAVNQNYTPTGSGNYYVINTASGCSSTSTFFNYNVLANDKFILSNDLKIYPNPTKSKINIDFGSQFNFIGSQVKLSNILGQEFYNSRINKQKTEIYLSSFATKGLYFISIVNSEGKVIANKKIILN